MSGSDEQENICRNREKLPEALYDSESAVRV